MSITYITLPSSPSAAGAPKPKAEIPTFLPMTAMVSIQPTHTILSPEVQPGNLDVLIIPGPDPSESFTEPTLEFVRGHANHDTHPADILSVCTGIFICAAAGILKDKQACGPRGLQGQLVNRYPDVEWVGHKLRWVQAGNVWSSGELSFCLARFFPCTREGPRGSIANPSS
jgi:transcriptional regulator GlxA family with amidase domain